MTLRFSATCCGHRNDNADPKLFEAHMKDSHGRNVKTWHRKNTDLPVTAYVRDGKLVTKPAHKAKYPEGTEPGQMVTFEYAGETRTGQVWCEAHIRKAWWVVPTERRVGETSALLVFFDGKGTEAQVTASQQDEHHTHGRNQ